ncbi:MAG: hypothetical protein LBQ83_03185 [Candidatus Margulisbacteria bacterium]|jgi:hypothetical protein|nr:hypothetical protein [Candidatus Margulisiibacteriota bacterium]
MKIVYLNTPIYDYLTATLIEGLTQNGNEVYCAENSNYGVSFPEKELLKQAENADIIIIGSNQGVKYNLLDKIINPQKVYVDGSDFQILENPEISARLIFKREYNSRLYGPNKTVYPLPFGAEKRFSGGGGGVVPLPEI